MSQHFRLFWLRETGCDAGSPLRADELEPEIRDRILELAADAPGEVVLQFPYLDRREWRRRAEILAGLAWERRDNVIVPVLAAGPALRTAAATLALGDPAWTSQPPVANSASLAVWRTVSMTLQSCFRKWISGEYFGDISRFADREPAYSMIVYQAARVCHGRSRGVFTYDMRDYPDCPLTVELATKMTGRSIQGILGDIEQRLREAQMPELARRYAPVWYQDVARAVRKKPRMFIELLAAESAFIDALVELGLNRTHAAVHHFTKIANQCLRNVCGMDLRYLGLRALEETSKVLVRDAAATGSGSDLGSRVA